MSVITQAILHEAQQCNREFLYRHPNYDLSSACRSLGIPMSGVKVVIIDRLLDYYNCNERILQEQQQRAYLEERRQAELQYLIEQRRVVELRMVEARQQIELQELNYLANLLEEQNHNFDLLQRNHRSQTLARFQEWLQGWVDFNRNEDVEGDFVLHDSSSRGLDTYGPYTSMVSAIADLPYPVSNALQDDESHLIRLQSGDYYTDLLTIGDGEIVFLDWSEVHPA
jgi:hypothetical protein